MGCASTQLQRVAKRTQELVTAAYRCWNESVMPALEQEGIRILPHHALDERQLAFLDKFFRERAFPILTPMAIDPSHPSPHFHNRQLYLGAMLTRHHGLGPKQLFAVVQLPQILPRFVPLGGPDESTYILLEDAISARLPELFGGFDILHSTTFRITRDSDIELLEQESDDMLRLIEERLKARQRGDAVRLEVAIGANEELVRKIVDEESLRDTGEGAHRCLQRGLSHSRAGRSDRHDGADPGSQPRLPAQCAVFSAAAAGRAVAAGRRPVRRHLQARSAGAPPVRFV